MLILISKATLPRASLLPPAELALKSLQALCLLSDRFKHRTFLDSLNPDGKALLDICWNLETEGYCQEDINDLNANSILDEHIKCVSKDIVDDDLAKLAILTWSVDASTQLLSQELFYFIVRLYEEFDILYPTLHTTYSRFAENDSTNRFFRQDFRKLLDSLKDRLTHEWNVIWKCTFLERQSTASYLALPRNCLLAMDNSFSRDSWEHHTISASAIYSNFQNEGTRPRQPEHPDDSSSKKEGNDEEERGLSSHVSEVQNHTVLSAEPAQAHDTEREQQIFLQLDTRPITEEQLVDEVRGIYAGLKMVENECIKTAKQHTESSNKLSKCQWQALVLLYQTLLHEHHDFYLASQHPSASPVLKELSEKYFMPARMWCHGIHPFLELLRHRLPDSLEHMLTFLNLAYSMMTLLLESVPAFEDTWVECLGDLARYRMAIEESDLQDRKTWASMARHWYHKAADRRLNLGRIQHHLAVLAWPDMLQELFYYTKSLVSVDPFPPARERITLLFHRALNDPEPDNLPIFDSAFVTAHGTLLTQGSLSDFRAHVDLYLLYLNEYICQLGSEFKTRGVFIASCNFAAIFQYGSTNAVLSNEFKEGLAQSETGLTASMNWTPVEKLDTIEAEFCEYQNSQSQKKLVYYSAHVTFMTLSALLDQIGNKNVFPAVHAYLAFIWCMTRNNNSIRHIELVVPWRKLTVFLNVMIWSNMDFRVMERDEIPVAEDRKCFPEDFLFRGQVWSQQYFSADYFDGALAEDDGRSIEVLSLTVARMYRCLWLGVQLAKFNRWIEYTSTSRRFSVKPFALELEKRAQHCEL
ncbi:hypothetical protein SI65_05746 [Aspergillus cristatus]|uniref:Uncharacterized protein n=1 Tax=Aspergillus cristatus TaxID=573508 RepID=A0A1E3BDW7_ASPCR|nr:hypothetical protein SI65_05746 [Aspergillus cristatus]